MIMLRSPETLDEQTDRVFAQADRVNSIAEAAIAKHVARYGKPSFETVYGMALMRLRELDTSGLLENPVNEQVLRACVREYYDQQWGMNNGL